MDVLTSILSSMKLSGSVFLEADFSGPWCVSSRLMPEDCAAFFPEPAHVISYHYVASGSLLCAVGDDPPLEVRAGQILLVPRNEQHVLGSCLSERPVSARDLMQPPTDGGLARIRWGGGGEPTKLFCGFLGTLTPVNSFLLSLPSILIIDATSGTKGEWLASSIRYASTETAARSPELLGRLAELLFAEAVKQHLDSLPEDQSGWCAGLRDPHVSRALTLLHTRYTEAWTTEDLAREVGLSRSALASRFTVHLGEPPMRYLARHRMNMAANLLQEQGQNASSVGYSVGFSSEAAFNRAFRKEFGVPPGMWRKEKCTLAAA
jgi:AraC-like DNA-binding protein